MREGRKAFSFCFSPSFGADGNKTIYSREVPRSDNFTLYHKCVYQWAVDIHLDIVPLIICIEKGYLFHPFEKNFIIARSSSGYPGLYPFGYHCVRSTGLCSRMEEK